MKAFKFSAKDYKTQKTIIPFRFPDADAHAYLMAQLTLKWLTLLRKRPKRQVMKQMERTLKTSVFVRSQPPKGTSRMKTFEMVPVGEEKY